MTEGKFKTEFNSHRKSFKKREAFTETALSNTLKLLVIPLYNVVLWQNLMLL